LIMVNPTHRTRLSETYEKLNESATIDFTLGRFKLFL